MITTGLEQIAHDFFLFQTYTLGDRLYEPAKGW